MARYLIILLPLLLLTGPAQAQDDPQSNQFPALSTQRLSSLGDVDIDVVDLPNRSIVTVQDQNGYMWFAADNLIRYDGIEYLVYEYDPDDSTSISFPRLETLFVDSDGTLWIGTFGGGLNRYNEATDTFTWYTRDPANPSSLVQDTVTAIIEDSQGALWIGTHGGLSRFDKATESFTNFRHNPDDPSSLSNDQVRALLEDSEGTLWVGTGSPQTSETPIGEGGLNRFDPATNSFTRFKHDPTDETSLFTNAVMTLYEDSKGVFWVGTSGDGLHSMNRASGTFTRHRYDPNDRTKLSRPFMEASEYDENCVDWDCGGVTFIHEDSQGMLWIGAIGGGINRYDRTASAYGSTETGAMSHHTVADINPSDITYWNISESHDGVLWVSTWGDTYKINSTVNSFGHLEWGPNYNEGGGVSFATSMYEDSDGTIWVGTRGDGLNQLDLSTGTVNPVSDLGIAQGYSPPLQTSTFYKMYQEQSGELLMANYDGIVRFRKNAQSIEPFATADDDHSFRYRSLDLLKDSKGSYWISSIGHGLIQYNPSTNEIIQHLPDAENPTSLSNANTLPLLEDENGNLWIGTFGNGLDKLSLESTESGFSNLLPGKNITALHIDASGQFWVGTWGDGLYLLDRTTGTSTRYGPSEGLPALRVAAILEDDDGYLWISTSETGQIIAPREGRLSRLDPITKSFSNFDRQDGLPNVDYFWMSSMKSRNGTLFFGGAGGITYFNPKTILPTNRRPPSVILTDLYISNNKIEPGSGSPLEDPIHLTDEIQLTAFQNNFTLDYTAFSYRDADQTNYQYRLDDYDADWVDARTLRSVRYARIPPGSYVFRVRARDLSGLQSEEASLVIEILPPWWRTVPMFIVYGMLLVAGLYGLDKIQRRRLLAKERERSRERELAQAREIEKAHNELQKTHADLVITQQQLIQQEKMASLGQLTAGIAHEIKNPLNFVNNFSSVNEELLNELKEDPNAKISDVEDIIDDIILNESKINQHGKRADRIVQSMMQHASGATGEIKEVDLNALVDEYVNLAGHGIRAQHPEFDVTIERQYGSDTGHVQLVPREIGQVLVNLFNNALDAMYAYQKNQTGKHKARLTVVTKRVKKGVEIQITDNGPGIPGHVREKIFEPFFTTKPTGSGTGLGLSLSYDIITQGHKGTLEVESEEGKGATFVIWLPGGKG